ncbi:GNAT family N-acetyltransferase [Alkalihalobacillus trypoxylicola]|uniref:N-acetyltransferase domain-containing protein n=1 Tax=Alkalihalobacillus trypoxylicola TaxID=519424 RepID=A0A162ES41_9BACI|nr:GNAT family N-acetyltransferase [Alkalihalobacillus trypoxylicola]KYG33579.1 hypothetical protein AZF04_16605 [Alkalihalobacillus trypoxylicola]
MNQNKAQIRYLLLEPLLRGKGIGNQLISKAITFATEKNISSIILWTNSELTAARKVYENFGFEIMQSKQSYLSGKHLTEDCWRLDLLK